MFACGDMPMIPQSICKWVQIQKITDTLLYTSTIMLNVILTLPNSWVSLTSMTFLAVWNTYS